jgi:hypothetical protein
MARSGQRDAARARAAEERRRQEQLRRRRRTLTIVAASVAAVVVAGGVTGAVLIGGRPGAPDVGRTTAPPWSAPSDVEARVRAAGLTMLTTEGTALHIHQHLTVTVDGTAVPVPADLGIDEAAQQLSAIHTHDTSGVIHVESPEIRAFDLGQVFTEWDVRLAPGAVGPYVNGKDGVALAVFVNQQRYSGDPRKITLTRHEDIDVVVTHGSAPVTPPKFDWPAGL